MHRRSRRAGSKVAVIAMSDARGNRDLGDGAVRHRGGGARPRPRRLNTSNPPGNEAHVADYMRDRLAPLGFEVDVIQTPTPGKAHLIARLRSPDPVGKPVVLCAHADTVGVERDLWSVDPFAGVSRGDFLYGRGSFDDKGGIAVFAQPRCGSPARTCPHARHRPGLRGRRGGRRLRDRLARRAPLGQARRRLSINEGGIISTEGGKPRLAAVTVRDKISLSVVLRTRGVSTHSSRPQPPSAIDRLARALTRISRHRSRPGFRR